MSISTANALLLLLPIILTSDRHGALHCGKVCKEDWYNAMCRFFWKHYDIQVVCGFCFVRIIHITC